MVDFRNSTALLCLMVDHELAFYTMQIGNLTGITLNLSDNYVY